MTLIHRSFVASVVGNDSDTPAQLSWTDTNPLACRLDVKCQMSHQWVEWHFALDLLILAMDEPQATQGSADVKILVDGTDTIVTLSSPDGAAIIETPTHVAEDFLAEVMAMATPQSGRSAGGDPSPTKWDFEVDFVNSKLVAYAMGVMVDTFLRELELA